MGTYHNIITGELKTKSIIIYRRTQRKANATYTNA